MSARPQVYWIPGCGNCIRVKGYLRDHGVQIDAVDVQSAGCGPEELSRVRAVGIPAVRLADRYASGIDLAAVALLLGIDDRSPGLLPVAELAGRADRFLSAAASLTTRIPAEHLDDPIPGMSGDIRPAIHRLDGTPYVPHRTNRELAAHLAGHGEKFVAFCGAPLDGLGWAAQQGEFSAFGEPPAGSEQTALAADLTGITDRLPRNCDAPSEVVDTFFGLQTRHQLLQTMTCALAQHTRQLADVVQRLGLDPAGAVDDGDLDGLQLPAQVWA